MTDDSKTAIRTFPTAFKLKTTKRAEEAKAFCLWPASSGKTGTSCLDAGLRDGGVVALFEAAGLRAGSDERLLFHLGSRSAYKRFVRH